MSFTFYDLQNKSFVVAQDVTKCQDFVESVVLTALWIDCSVSTFL